MSSLTILTLAIIAAANMAVGGCIGICGIAGFLLPLLYTGGLGFDVTYALALSFLAFLVSGIIGSFNYYKAGNLEVRMSLKLGIGSLIGHCRCVPPVHDREIHSKNHPLSGGTVFRCFHSGPDVE